VSDEIRSSRAGERRDDEEREEMTATGNSSDALGHSHAFLGKDHERGERNTWMVIALCTAMMIAEIVGGLMFGSIALVADGFHMSTHAGALLLAALAYTLARRSADDRRFTFGTGKFGDLAGFTSAIILAMIALFIAYESASRFFSPTPIQFAEAIPIATLGLAVNALSAWLLSRGGDGHHHHGHGHHGHDHGDAHAHDESRELTTALGAYRLEIFEAGAPPRFRLRRESGAPLDAAATSVEITRSGGARQRFAMADRGGYLESVVEIPEPHEFAARVQIGAHSVATDFAERSHAHDALHRDNNMRAAIVHVMADAAVSIFVIVGLLLARGFGWLWMDPLAGLVGAGVIASWSAGLIRDTGAVLLDMNPDRQITQALRRAIERDGDRLADLHLWRLGPGHLGAILSIETDSERQTSHYREAATGAGRFSHLTIEIVRRPKSTDREPRRFVA
jgi:cation diffusion facilitator family transporter